MAAPRIGVVGATGAVGTITLELLAERGYDVRAFASARSAGSRLPFGDEEILVEEATPEALSAGDVDLFLFSVGTGAKLHLEGPIRIGPDYAAFAFQVRLTMDGKVATVDVIDVFRFNEAGKVRRMEAYFGPGNFTGM